MGKTIVIGDKTFSLLAAIVGRDLNEAIQPYLMMDRQFLKRTAVPGAEYVWTFGGIDTHLWMIGVHGRYVEQAREWLADSRHRAFHVRVSETGKVHVNEISIGQARRMMMVNLYEVDGDAVFKSGELVGKYSLTVCRQDHSTPVINIDLHPVSPLECDAVALRLIAECEAVDFCGTTAFRVDRVTHHHLMRNAA